MDDTTAIDQTIKAIIFDIKAQCFHDGHLISDALAVMVMKAVVLENQEEYDLDGEMSAEQVEAFTSLCVDRITEKNSPSLATMQMQVAFESASQEQEEKRDQRKRAFVDKCNKMLHEIAESKAKSVGGLEALYRKIVSYVITQSALGAPTDTGTVRETTAALESIFPQSELVGFVQLPRGEKEEHLKQFAALVTGIRLFNMEIGQGGSGVRELPKMCNDLGKSLSYDLYQKMEGLQDLVAQYSVVINAAEKSVQAELEEVDVVRHKEELVNARQYQFYCQLLQTNVEASREQIGIYVENYEAKLVELQTIVKSQTAVATEAVFPRFLFLAHMWEGLQEEEEILQAIGAISDAVHPFSTSFESALRDEDVETSFALKAETDARTAAEEAAAEAEVAERGGAPADGAVVVSAEEVEAAEVVTEYKGFCPWTLVARDGLLLQGDVSLGLVVYNERYYALASSRALAEFLEHPEAYVAGVAEAARRSPELIALLGIEEAWSGVGRLEEIRVQMGAWGRDGSSAGKSFSDAQCGTDDYELPSGHDEGYEWNEWAMRRKALLLVNLRNKRTHSTQTHKSQFRREAETQVYVNKENGTQTGIDKGVNHAKRVQKVMGLRGGRQEKVHVVSVELEL